MIGGRDRVRVRVRKGSIVQQDQVTLFTRWKNALKPLLTDYVEPVALEPLLTDYVEPAALEPLTNVEAAYCNKCKWRAGYLFGTRKGNLSIPCEYL